MQKKYLKTITSFLVLIIVFCIVYYIFYKNKQKIVENVDNVTWEFIEDWQVSYPSDWVVIPERYQSPGQQATGLPSEITGYTFSLPDGATFSIGGHQPMSCADNKFVDTTFIYGVTTSFCFNDQVIKISSQSTQDDKNAFGDFILKNILDLQTQPDSEISVGNVVEQKLQFCPDMKINNMFPTAIDLENPEENQIPKEYYIFQEERYELYEFNSNWLESNCDIKEETVY